MPSPHKPPPPFTRLPTDDPAVSDIYDKLNVIANRLANGTATAPLQAPLAAQPSIQSGIRSISKSDFLLAADSTLLAEIAFDSSVVLPNTSGFPSKPVWIKNASTSAGDLSLQSPDNQKVDGAAATAVTLAPAKAICIQAVGSGWLILARIL